MAELKYLELYGERLAYVDEGQGEVLLLLHGMAGSSETWRSVVRPLSRNFRVVAPDLLGHGGSDKPRSDYSLGAFAVLLRDLLDALGIARVTLVGHSLGGGIAMQFSYQHPEYCRGLILIDSGGLGPDVGLTLRLLSAPGAELIMPIIAPKAVLAAGNRFRSWLHRAGIESPRGEQIWTSYSSFADAPTRAAFQRTLRSVIDYRGQAVNALSRLRDKIDVPVMLIWGDQDAIIPIEHAYATKELRPDIRLEVLTGVGHFPPAERPAEVVELIEDFVTHDVASGASGRSPCTMRSAPLSLRPACNHELHGVAGRIEGNDTGDRRGGCEEL